MGKSKKQAENEYGGEEEDSQVEDEQLEEMFTEAEQEEIDEMMTIRGLKVSIKETRKRKGDIWTANFIKQHFPSIDRLINL